MQKNTPTEEFVVIDFVSRTRVFLALRIVSEHRTKAENTLRGEAKFRKKIVSTLSSHLCFVAHGRNFPQNYSFAFDDYTVTSGNRDEIPDLYRFKIPTRRQTGFWYEPKICVSRHSMRRCGFTKTLLGVSLKSGFDRTGTNRRGEKTHTRLDIACLRRE